MKMLFFIVWIFSTIGMAGVEPLGVKPLGSSIEVADPTTNGAIPEVKPLQDYFKPGTKHPLGVRPDCSETKVDIKQIESLAKKESVTNTVDFLKSLNKDYPDSFQTFTLVTNSKSAQRCEGPGMVSDEWPRVLRTSVDGKISFSYTCNPASCAYNKIEVIYYDDAGKEMNTMSIDLNQKPDHRAQKNEESCLNCHAPKRPDGTRSVKPIWPEYFQWGGCKNSNSISMYGSNDDTMNPKDFRDGGGNSKEYKACSNEELKTKQLEEITNFKKFKAKNLGEGANNNPCYSTLPWAKPVETIADKTKRTKTPPQVTSQFDQKKYENYPYTTNRTDSDFKGNDDENENLYLRTNMRFTQNYARLNAKRIAGIIQKSPNFERIKIFLAMEAGGCLRAEDEKSINQVLPNLNYKYAPGSSGYSADHPSSETPLTYAYAKMIGIPDSDWSLELRAENAKYNAALPRYGLKHGGNTDMTTAAVVGGELTSFVASEDKKVAEKFKNGLTRGAAEGSGPQWSCLDETGAAVRPEFKGIKRPLCVSLREAANTYLQQHGQECLPEQAPVAKKLAAEVELIKGKLDNQKVSDGKKIIEKACIECHTANPKDPNYDESLAFFEDPKYPLNEEQKTLVKKNMTDKLIPNVMERIKKDGGMPMGKSSLSDEEQSSVLQYIESAQRSFAK